MCTAKYFRLCAVLTCLAAAAAGGCSKKIVITQYPQFYTPQLKTIAVVSFRNQSTGRNAGNIIADKLAATLMANAAYKVFNRNDLSALMDESDLKIAMGGDTSAAAGKFRKLTDVQAILTGAVSTYSATSQSQRKRDPIYGRDRNGNSYVQGYRTYVYTRNEANVSVTAVLIRVSDGTTIYATPRPATAMVYSQGSPPRRDPHACAAQATDAVVARLVETFAPVRKQIKVNTDKALRTASERYDNKWTFADTFQAADEKMYGVVSLPPSCDRNRFRLVVVRKDQREELASRNIIWSRQDPTFGYLFSPRQLAAKGGGPGEYEVKFYSGPDPVFRRTFRIK